MNYYPNHIKWPYSYVRILGGGRIDIVSMEKT